ncbi:MAG: hypothetical protein ACTHU0_25705 [Kofleriaceae bacterium]
MIRRHVLAALHAGIDTADEDAARRVAGRADWILRGQIRRRLEHALIDASLATGVHGDGGGDPEATRHRLRAAALIAAGHALDRPEPAAVAEAHARLDRRAPARLPLATIGAAGLALLCATGLVAAAVGVVAADPEGRFERPTPPAPVGAYRDGGVPARDPALELLLARELPGLVASKQVGVLRDHPAIAAHGPAQAGAWRAMIGTLEQWLAADPDAPGVERRADELRARTFVVSDQLAAAQLGYYVEAALLATHGRRRPGVYTYRVDDVAFVRASDERVRVLGMRRLDPANDGMAALGMAGEELEDPVVLLDQVDDKVTRQILPVLRGEPYVLGDPSWARTRIGRQAGAAAGDAIRRELLTALGPDLEAIERATTRCQRLVAASVRHHEAQHVLDRTRALPHPAALAAHVPSSGEFGLRTRLELSAYLSQVAADMWLPQLVLWNLARHAFRPTYSASEEAYAAVAAIEGLARRLAIASPGPVIHDGRIDRDRLAALVGPLAARPTHELRSAAAALWGELFGRRLPRIVDDRRPGQNT